MTADISVIIPCFNRVDLLKQTLKSVESAIQNLKVEIILVDDGSDIPIQDQIPEFSHLSIKFIRQKNSGLTISRYNGLMAASGDYIQFLDSDDQIAPDKLIEQVIGMRESNADVSHTDVLETFYNQDKNELETIKIVRFKHTVDPAEFYIGIQPAPHSPIFRKDYLLNNLAKKFIPLNREYDSIGEVWFYYNLSVFDAKIIKIDKPLTICIKHSGERLTNHWERLGLCALNLQLNFIKYYPKDIGFKNSARKFVGRSAFITYRCIPKDMYPPFQNAFLKVWSILDKTHDVNGGKYFNILSSFIGYRNSAVIAKKIGKLKYEEIRTIEHEELVDKTNSILQNFQTV
jgi:glycosyltransferase involved in cell wall biosynthesis